jgi:hypothetical protein
VIADIVNFLQDPANAPLLYAISAFLVLDAIVLHFVRKKIVIKAYGGGVAVGGIQSGIIVTGKVKGGVSQHREVTAAARDAHSPNTNSNAPTVDRTLSLLANLSGIIGLILAALTFYLTFYSGAP